MGKKCCEVCFKKCKGYTIRIEENVYVHSECFKCHDCRADLDLSKFYFKNKCLYCVKDFKKHFYPKCFKCLHVIEEEMMTVMGQHYHFDCLTCFMCKKTSVPGDKLNFDGKNLICPQCTLKCLKEKSSDQIDEDHQKETNELVGNNVKVNEQKCNNLERNKSSSVSKCSANLFVKSDSLKTNQPKERKDILQQDPPLLNDYRRCTSGGGSSGGSDSFPAHLSSYLDMPSYLNFKRSPSVNVANNTASIHHFHVPDSCNTTQRFSREKSKTMPTKKPPFRPKAKNETSLGIPVEEKSKQENTIQGINSEPKSQKLSNSDPKSPQRKSSFRDDRDISRETLSRTPLPCISEDGLSLTSYASVCLPSKGYALKPGYGLKPIIYAYCGTAPESKQHLFSAAVSGDDSKDTKSISLGSEHYSSFYSMPDEDKMNPYTGLKRNKSTRSTISYDPRISKSKTLTEIVESRRHISVSDFLKKSSRDEGLNETAKKYTYEELKYRLSSLSPSKLINKEHLEDYLTDEEFKRLFLMDISQFKKLPEWKKMDLKKKKNLI